MFSKRSIEQSVLPAEGRSINNVPRGCFWTSTRFVMAVVGFFGTFNLYSQRVTMSVAIVCMVNKTYVSKITDESVQVKSECRSGHRFTNETAPSNGMEGVLRWDSALQGQVLGAYFWGYCLLQIPAGVVCQRYGAKLVLLTCTAAAAVATLLTPAAAATGAAGGTGSAAGVIALRGLTGMAAGIWFPSFHYFWSQWAPAHERATLLGITYSGMHAGTVVALPVASLLCKYGFAGGWPSIFYVSGIFGILWCVLCWILIYNTADSHTRISEAERLYIEENVTIDEASKRNGILSAVPYIGYWIISIWSSVWADFIIRRKLLTITQTRKMNTAVAFLVPASFIVTLGHLDCTQRILAIAFLTLACSAQGFLFGGALINHVDIGARCAGIVMGISNAIAAANGYIGVVILGYLQKNDVAQGFRTFFYITLGISVFSAIFFCCFASGEKQKWASKSQSKLYSGGMENVN